MTARKRQDPLFRRRNAEHFYLSPDDQRGCKKTSFFTASLIYLDFIRAAFGRGARVYYRALQSIRARFACES